MSGLVEGGGWRSMGWSRVGGWSWVEWWGDRDCGGGRGVRGLLRVGD